MKIYQYESYEEYVKAQTDANKRKINKVWVQEDVLKLLKKYKKKANIILCHGTRNAAEQKILKDLYPDAKTILGTEISETANQFPDTIQHDFHNELPEYTGKCDIIYSNSFDHSFDPELCLRVWRDQLNARGKMFLEIMIGAENKSKLSDPLEIKEHELKSLAENLGMKFVGSELGIFGKSELLVFSK